MAVMIGMGRIAEESIQQVMTTVNIVDVISSYFPLKRVGLSYKASCPFHPDRTPSFHVNPQRNSFHCFSCGKGGSAIRFVMDHEGLPFIDAVRKLAEKHGIHLKEVAGSRDDTDDSRALRARLMTLHRDIAQWFHMQLLRSPLAGQARDYLKKRGLNSDVAKRWKIGYAPQDPRAYREWCTEMNYSEGELVVGGIFSPRDEAQPEHGGYPRFKHRIMFPIHDDHGNVIAFSGRVLDAAASPAKYVNSPGTPLFKKSDVFFGLEKSKKGIHKAGHAIICEGQIDMLICFENGIENIVAPLGTAFTASHARLLKRHTEQVTLCYDSDSAGLKAAQSAYSELSKEGIFVRVATMPQGDDPDSLIRREGVEALKTRLGKAKDFIDFFIDLKAPGVDPDNLRERMQLLSTTTGHIARLRDRMAQDTAITRAATQLGAPAAELRRMVTAHAQHMLKQQEIAQNRPPNENFTEMDVAPHVLVIENAALRQLLRLALTDTMARAWLVRERASLTWRGISGGELLERVLTASLMVEDAGSVTGWLATLATDEESVLTGLLHDNNPSGGQEAAERASLTLRLQAARARMDVLNALQNQRGLPRDEVFRNLAEIAALQKEHLDLQAKMRDIRVDR